MAVSVQQQSEDPAHHAILDELRRLAIDTYGEERANALQTALAAAATAVWRVTQEPLEPSDPEP
jgi:hypothetical protein